MARGPLFAATVLLAVPAAAEDRRYMLTGFESVRVEGPYDVTIRTGSAPGASASGDRSGFESIDVRGEGRVLIVRAGQEAWGGYPGAKRSPPRLTVTVPALRAARVDGGGRLSVDRMAGQSVDLQLNGAGRIDVAELRTDRLNAVVVGTGALKVGGKVQRARFAANGAGSIDARALDLDALTLDWLSVGEAAFTVRYTAEVSAQGQGPVEIAGSPACKIAGPGPVACGNIVKRR